MRIDGRQTRELYLNTTIPAQLLFRVGRLMKKVELELAQLCVKQMSSYLAVMLSGTRSVLGAFGDKVVANARRIASRSRHRQLNRRHFRSFLAHVIRLLSTTAIFT